MKYIALDPHKSEPFKKKMTETGWPITHQDVGQTEILAYGYVIVWQKDDKKVMMNYEDRQGQVRVNLEVSVNAGDEIQSMVDSIAA